MGYKYAIREPEREITIQYAITAVGRLQFRVIHAIAARFSIPVTTIHDTMAPKKISRSKNTFNHS